MKTEKAAVLPVTAAILLGVAMASAGCGGGGEGSCLVGEWVTDDYVVSLDDCSECVYISYLVVKASGTFALIREAKLCEWGAEKAIEVAIIDSTGYRVNGDSLRLDGTEAVGTMTCDGDALTIVGLGSGDGGGSWTRLAGEEAAAVEGLLHERCDAFTSCIGLEAGAGQCSAPDDCPTPPSAADPTSCDDGRCYFQCW